MRKQPLPLEPFNPIRIGAAIWTTELMIARKIVEAVREQNTLILRAIRNRPLIRSIQTERKALPPRRPAPAPAGTDAQLNRVLVCGESGDNEAFLATPLDGVPVEAGVALGSGAMCQRRSSFVFLRSES